MVYKFEGHFNLNKNLGENLEVLQKIQILSLTRRIPYNLEEIAKKENKTIEEVVELYGVEGEFYNFYLSAVKKEYPNPLDWQIKHFYNKKDFFPNNFDLLYYNYDAAPLCQPTLKCPWRYNKEKNVLESDGDNEFIEDYADWLVYIVNVVLKPEGFIVNGDVKYIHESTNSYANEIRNLKEFGNNIIEYNEIDYNNNTLLMSSEMLGFKIFNKGNKELYQEMCKRYFKVKKDLDLRMLKKKKRAENFRENLKRVKLSNDLDFKFKNNSDE
ncbi:hypothetical protein ABK040_016532 [Willaertia magna]